MDAYSQLVIGLLTTTRLDTQSVGLSIGLMTLIFSSRSNSSLSFGFIALRYSSHWLSGFTVLSNFSSPS